MSKSTEQATLLILKGVISDLEEEDRDHIRDTAQRFRDILSEDDRNMLALALVGAEVAADA